MGEETYLTLKIWLLIVALFCAGMVVAIDLSWLDPDHPHIAAWVGLSLFFYMAREVER